jgi:hypothetical protein
MDLCRFLRCVGFEHDDVAGGLLAEHPAMRLIELRERLENRIRKVYGRLVRHRRVLEELRPDVRQKQSSHIPALVAVRFQRHERAYIHDLQRLARLRCKFKRVQAKLV